MEGFEKNRMNNNAHVLEPRMKNCTLLILLTMLLPNSASASDQHRQVITLKENVPLLFVDDSGVEVRHTLFRTIHQAQRLDAPVLTADKPWEVRRVYLATVEYDSDAQKFCMWYLARLPPNNATQLLYATSTDGLSWDKPLLGQFSVQGSTENNVLNFVGDGGGEASVIVDSFEKDPAKKYKLFIHNRNGYCLGYSADGIHWHEHSGNPILKHGDTCKLTQNQQTGEYLAYYKRPATVRGFHRRVVWLSRSMDFRNWTEPELAFAPDEVDDEWVMKADERTEIYLMSVFGHAAGYVGLPAMFFHMPQVLDGSKTPNGGALSSAGGAVTPTGPMDIQLITSIDGSHWKRSSPRISVIKRGPPGAYDAGAIYNTDSSPVHVGKETWMYYTAINTGHGAPIPPKSTTIGLAKWRRHGYVSLNAGPEGGHLQTKPLRFMSPKLFINADASRGQLQVALLEADGTAIPGRGFDESEVMHKDSTKWQVRWNDVSDIPQNRPVRVSIRLANTRLFSLESSDASGR